MNNPARDAAGRGILAMVAACTIWGLSAIYYHLIEHIPPLEVLSHRTIWSLVLLTAYLIIRGRFRQLVRLMSNRKSLAIVVASGLLISINWFIFIFSVQLGRVIETSLGYYIFPLVAVALGYLFLGERLSRWQGAAVALAVLAVLVLTAGLGVAPWISLGLAFSFGFYGLVKARIKADAVLAVTAEVAVLSPLALVWIWGVNTQGWTGLVGRTGGFFGHDAVDTWLLIGAGLVTLVPLVLLGYAVNQLRLSTVGLVQYLNPTIQFVIAVTLFSQPVTPWHMIAFPLIWLGLAVYSWDSIQRERPSAAMRAGTDSLT